MPFVSTNNNYANQKTTCLLSFRSHVSCLFWETENKLWKVSGQTLSVSDTLLGSLSSNVFERRTSTGSEPFSLLVSLYATVFVLPSVLILKETICSKICSKSRLKCAKSPFPVHVRRSKTSLLKLSNSALLTAPSQNPVSTPKQTLYFHISVNVRVSA